MNAYRLVLALILLPLSLPARAANDDQGGVPDASSCGPALAASSVPAGLANATPEQISKFFNSKQYRNLHRSDCQFLKDLYQVIFHREPDAQGFADWMHALAAHPGSRSSAIRRFLGSEEYKNAHKQEPADSCAQIYKIADDKKFQGPSFFSSYEYKQFKRSDANFLKDVYCLLLRRPPDPKGYADWLKYIETHKSDPKVRTNVVVGFVNSPEYKALHPGDNNGGNTGGSEVNGQPGNYGNGKRIPANALFDKTGLFVDQPGAFPLDYVAKETGENLLKLAKIGWIGYQIDNGANIREEVRAVFPGLASMLRQRVPGIKVGLWGVPRGPGYNAKKMVDENRQSELEAARASMRPIVAADAARAAQLAVQLGADFYVADLEGPFQWGEGDPEMNAVYVQAFNKAAPAGLARALSSMGRVGLDMQPWIQTGWDALPQAYWNSYAHYQPSLCVTFYMTQDNPAAKIWPRGRIHPTIATYRGEGENRGATLEEYAADLAVAKTKGFSFYLGEMLSYSDRTDWAKLGSMSR